MAQSQSSSCAIAQGEYNIKPATITSVEPNSNFHTSERHIELSEIT